MIPEFNPEEVLPEKEISPYCVLPKGIYDVELSEMHCRFVTSFADSTTRSTLFNKFSSLHIDTAVCEIKFCQWIAGSFVTSKIDPSDVDVMTIIHRDEANALSESAVEFVNTVLDGHHSTEEKYGSHTFYATYFPTDDPRHETSVNRLQEWRDFWCQTRKLQDRVSFRNGAVIEKGENCPKGILCLRSEGDIIIPSIQ